MSIKTEILTTIKKYQTIIIHRHQRPDPDAIGSQTGLAEILKASFPKKDIYVVGEETPGLHYLQAMDKIDDRVFRGALILVTDTANAPRISDCRYRLGQKLIKIDHHPDDEPYGDLSWVETSASSCSEMIYDFYAEFSEQLKMTDEAARLLYAGIIGDTGRFLHPSTTAHTLAVASNLRDYSFDAAGLTRHMNEIPLNVSKLSGYALSNLKIDSSGAAKVIISQAVLEKYQGTDEQTAALIPLPGQIRDVRMWAIFVEQEQGYYRVRMRSKEVPVNEIAKGHHGGGHPLASGANARNLKEVNEIFTEMKAALEKRK